MDEKQAVTQVFNLIATRYDNPSLRFFPLCAEKIVDYANIMRGQTVLDIATGTGVVALAAAQVVGSEGQVHAIDLSEKMLDRAKEKLKLAGLTNVDFHIMDGEILEFEDNSFDVITCSYGLFFMPDMSAALNSWRRVLKPGGKIIFSSFTSAAFHPLSEIFIKNLGDYGITVPTPRWLHLAEEDLCKSILTAHGFESAQVNRTQLGYHHSSTRDWWEVIQSAGYRGLYEQLPHEHRSEFQDRHLAEIGKRVTDQGLWMDVETLISIALKPA